MAHIEGIRIKNYKALKDITLGKLWNNHESPLSDLTVVIGKNGVFDCYGNGFVMQKVDIDRRVSGVNAA